MDSRFKKFMEDDFNFSDLESLRNDVANMTDEELSAKLDEMIDIDDFQPDNLDRVQHRLNFEITAGKRNTAFHRLLIGIAAVLVVALMVSGVFLYNLQQNCRVYEELLSHEISIGTRRGENTTTILPDGSSVVMCPKSNLAYKLSSFNKKERRVHFSGEARFDIVKNKDNPFFVHSNDFEIEVLGTVFSVLSRDDNRLVEIHLEQGSIVLTASKSKNQRTLRPGDTAFIDKQSGDVKVYGPGEGVRQSACRDVQFFSSETLEKVFEVLTLYYGKDFVLDRQISSRTFTGSLPTDNLGQALYVLEQTLNLSISRSDNVYYVR